MVDKKAKDRDALLSFEDFPVPHWADLRTSNLSGLLSEVFTDTEPVLRLSHGAVPKPWLQSEPNGPDAVE